MIAEFYRKQIEQTTERMSVGLVVGQQATCTKYPTFRGEFNWEHRWICSGLNCDCPECPRTETA